MPLPTTRLIGSAAALLATGLLSATASANTAAGSATKPSAGATAKPNAAAAKAPAAKPAPAKPVAAAKPAPPRPAPVPATPRQQLNNEARGLALASQTATQISAGQLDVAARVLTGMADCEFRQQVGVAAVEGKPGHFTVSHQGKRYDMLPEETSTGAVRLEDKRNGIVWLQIPAKSMLMNAKMGQRMVDNCTQSEQRAALAAVRAAAASSPDQAASESGGLGITAAPQR